MGFSIRLGTDLAVVEAGATVPVTVVIDSRNPNRDQFEIDIEGIDPEWKAVPVPVVACEPNATAAEKFFFKPPRSSESLAGNYPFVLKVRSLESGETHTVQGVLEVRPFHHLSMEISPKRGVVSPTSQQNQFDISVVNLGNTTHTVRLQGNDPEDALAFEFEQDQVIVGPGQQREVVATAVPTTSRVVSSARLIGFTVTGRSVDVPSVVTSSQAQLEQRSLFSPASLSLMLLVLLIGVVWFLNMPRPPSVEVFTVSPTEVEMGKTVTLHWSSPDASIIHLSADGTALGDQSTKTGDVTFETPTDPGKDQVVFECIAERNGRRSEPARISLRLIQPEVVADPKIDKLSVSPTRVKLGEPFVLTYKFSDSVTQAILSPDNIKLEPALPSISVPTHGSGRVTYTVTAYNKANKTVAKTFTVNVVDESEATILSFMASPNPVDPAEGKVTLNWSVMKAVKVQIKASDRPLSIDETASSGTLEVPVTTKTTFTLTAYDENGKPTSQSQIVTMKEPPKTPVGPPIEDQPPTVPPGTGGGTPPTTP